MLIAVAAMAFVSCQKDETAAPETVSATLTMHADVEQTKTYLNENNAVLWGKGEAVTLYVGAGETAKFFDSASTDYDGVASASFTFEIKDVTEADSYALGGIYPASASLDDNNDPKKCKTILPQIQNAESGKYDPSAYIMVLKPETVETLPTEYQASFRRATALNKITLTNVKEDITTVEITVPKGQDLAGRRYFNLTDGTSGEIYYEQSNTITVNSKFTGSSIDVWFCSWGVELAAGEEMTIRMKNSNKSFTRTIVAKGDGIKFVEGDLNTLKIDMASAKEESFDSFAGEWLITGTTGGVTYAAGSYVSGNNIKASVALNISNDVIEPVDGLDKCKMFFTMITEGEYKGMYTIQDANGKYLYAASSSGNQLKAGTSAENANYYWAVECTDGKYTVVASKSSNRNVMQFNGSDASNMLFACYTSASQGAITLYPYSMVKVDTTPKIVVSGETTKDVVFGGETVTFNYELKYLEGEDLTWEVSNSEIITEVTAVEGVLSVTVAENTGEARTATITLSCGAAETVVLTISQAEYVDTSVIEKITVAEFLKKSVDATVWYELTGVVSNISNTQYGNFNLTDATGIVYVYGLTAKKVTSNDKSFASIGLNEGDVVTLIGTRAVHNNNPEVGGPAYYVSHQHVSATPSISCKDNVVTITAATGATIYYTTDGTDPTTESKKYTTAFEITEDTPVKAIAVEDGKLASVVAESKCTWVDPNAGSGDEPAEDIILTVDWATNVGSLETSGLTSSFTIGGYSYTASGTSCYYYAKGKACFLGKSGAYVQVPQIAGYKLTNVTLKSASSTGGATVTIKTTSNGAATGTTATFANGQSKEFSFDITNPQVNTSYRITVTNSKNAHIAKWVLTYEPAN